MLALLGPRQMAQALHDGVIVHHDHGLVIADRWNAFSDRSGKVETAALPITGQILRAARDTAVRLDDTGAADANDRRQGKLLLLRALDQRLQQFRQMLDGLGARDFLVGMTP